MAKKADRNCGFCSVLQKFETEIKFACTPCVKQVDPAGANQTSPGAIEFACIPRAREGLCGGETSWRFQIQRGTSEPMSYIGRTVVWNGNIDLWVFCAHNSSKRVRRKNAQIRC
jgi:hypothetical protein